MCVQNCNIGLGDVFLLQCNLCNPPKLKYFVVAQSEPLRMLLINSKMTDYQQARPEFASLILLMRASQHQFLKYDSYLCCDHLSHEYKHDQLAEMIRSDPAIRLGRLHDDVRPYLAGAFERNELLPVKYLKDLRPLWAV